MSAFFALQVRVKPGLEDEFLERYARLRDRVADGLEGHIVHLLCQGIDDPDQWLIASWWETLEASQEWESSTEHRELTMPLRECWDEAQRTRYAVREETRRPELRPERQEAT
jgi:heme-degrading monooxygenase HmoA